MIRAIPAQAQALLPALLIGAQLPLTLYDSTGTHA